MQLTKQIKGGDSMKIIGTPDEIKKLFDAIADNKEQLVWDGDHSIKISDLPGRK